MQKMSLYSISENLKLNYQQTKKIIINFLKSGCSSNELVGYEYELFIDRIESFDFFSKNNNSLKSFAFSNEYGGQLELISKPFGNIKDLFNSFVEIENLNEYHPYLKMNFSAWSLKKKELKSIIKDDKHASLFNYFQHARAELAQEILSNTCAFQLSFDYKNEIDFSDRYRKAGLINYYISLWLLCTLNGVEKEKYIKRLELWFGNHSCFDIFVRDSSDEIVDFEVYANYVLNQPLKVLYRFGAYTQCYLNKSLKQLLIDNQCFLYKNDILLHLHMIYPLVRAKNVIELRVFGSVPVEVAQIITYLASGCILNPKPFDCLDINYIQSYQSLLRRSKNENLILSKNEEKIIDYLVSYAKEGLLNSSKFIVDKSTLNKVLSILDEVYFSCKQFI